MEEKLTAIVVGTVVSVVYTQVYVSTTCTPRTTQEPGTVPPEVYNIYILDVFYLDFICTTSLPVVSYLLPGTAIECPP